jgi:hypothetical protein
MPKRKEPINLTSDHGSIFNELIINSETSLPDCFPAKDVTIRKHQNSLL